MYVRGTRYSFTGNGADEGGKIYNGKAKPMWSGQKGFHSMQRFRIADGPNKDQQYVVLRFESKDAWEKAREACASQRDEMLKGLETAGVKAEEVMELEEIV
jgi:hypothetical protein